MESVNTVNLSLEEKCMDKSWMVRLKSYEEVTKLFRQIKNRKSPEFHRFIGLIKNFVTDNHATAQEKGLEAALAYIENYTHAKNIVHDVMNGIVTKCIAARREKTKELAMQITHKYVQLGKQEAVQEELLNGMEQKKNQPKTISACINAFISLLQKFGTQIINVEPLMQRIGPLLSDRDKTVRDDTKLMVVELYKWIGRDAMVRRLKKVNIQAIQMNELDEEFKRVDSEKIAMQKMEVKSIEKDPTQSSKTSFLLPKDFYEKIQARTWQERKEALQNIERLLTTPLQSANYSDLIRALTVVIDKDPNVICVALAGKCLVLLANGLKDKFQNYCSLCIPILLEKFKERKQCVITSIQEALDSIYSTTTLEFILENILQALNNKSPSVKAETQLFLNRNFRKTSPSINNDKGVLAALTSALLRNLQDSDSSVRETSAETLGSLMQIVGENTMVAHLEGVDDLKMLKIKEYSNNIAVKTKEISHIVSSETVKEIKKTKTSVLKNVEKELSEEEIDRIVMEIFTTDIINNISSSGWKARLQAAQQMLTIIQTKSSNIPTQAVIRFLFRKPGLKDTNFQVVKAKLDIIKHLAKYCKFTTTTANCCVAVVCERFTDSKNIVAVVDTLNAIVEATSLSEVGKTVIHFAFNQKSPKVQQESLIWLSEAVKEFGFRGLNANFFVDAAKQGISCSNGAVRRAAITLLGIVYSYVGDSLFGLIEGTKNSVLELIKAECEKYNDETPTAPTRSVKKIEKIIEPDIPTVQIKLENVAIVEAPVIDDNEKDDNEEVDTSPLLKINTAKERRNSKWQFDHPTKNEIKLLKCEMMAAEVNKTLMSNMFHSDPKHHRKAIELLSENYGSEALICNLDLILKWFTLRLFDVDTVVILSGLEFLRTLLITFQVQNYKMSPYEIFIFVPHLIRKLDSPLRDKIKEILQQITRLQREQMYNYFIEGIESKSVVQKCECLDLLAYLIGNSYISISDECLKKIAQCISDEDKQVQTNALNCMTQAYRIVGEKIYEFLPENNNLILNIESLRVKAKVVSPKELKKDGPKLLKEIEHTSCKDKIFSLRELQIQKTNQELTELLKVKVSISPNKQVRSGDYLTSKNTDENTETLCREIIQKHSEKVKSSSTPRFEEICKVFTFRKPNLSHCSLSAVDQQTLTNIFEKLHTEGREEGLALLYDFMQRHSGVNIKPFLDASSKSVQNYVPNGLEDLQKWHALRKIMENVKKQFE